MCDQLGYDIGGNYTDVLRHLPEMKPYAHPSDYHYIPTLSAVMQVVYTLSDYNHLSLPPALFLDEVEFLRESVDVAIDTFNSAEATGEILDSLKTFGYNEEDPLIQKGTSFLLETQNEDGSWGGPQEVELGLSYHTTIVAIWGLRHAEPVAEGPVFKETIPMLEQWAKERKPRPPAPVEPVEEVQEPIVEEQPAHVNDIYGQMYHQALDYQQQMMQQMMQMQQQHQAYMAPGMMPGMPQGAMPGMVPGMMPGGPTQPLYPPPGAGTEGPVDESSFHQHAYAQPSWQQAQGFMDPSQMMSMQQQMMQQMMPQMGMGYPPMYPQYPTPNMYAQQPLQNSFQQGVRNGKPPPPLSTQSKV